jgi:hypothetical protein
MIRENEEYGGYGIVVKEKNADYFEPALSGALIAHDLLEHPVHSHHNGYIDEFMALGGVLAGRYSEEWTTRYGGIIKMEDLHSDIHALAFDAYCVGANLCSEECKSYLNDSDLMNQIREVVKDAIKDAYYVAIDSDGEDYVENQNQIDWIVSWICKGYQLHRQRFSKYSFGLCSNLFNQISDVCEKWLKESTEYESAKLYVNFAKGEVKLISEYD